MLEKLSIGKKVFIAALIFLVLIISVAAYETLVSIRQHGTVKVIGISVDKSEIDWGTICIGESKSEMLRVTNDGLAPVTLKITVLDIPIGLTLNHNYTGAVLQPTETLSLNLTLTVGNIVQAGPFEFSLIIEAVDPQ